MIITDCESRCNIELYMYVIIALISYFRMSSATITNSKYREVTKTMEQNHAGSVLTTSSWNSKLGCASSCDTPQCISFSYNSVTKQCRTYGVEICYRDDGVTSSSLRFYTKVVQFNALKNCGDVPTAYCSRVYSLTIAPDKIFDVFCDIQTSGGPWTVIASRHDGSVDFYKQWNDYRNGFGSLVGEFWLGFEKTRLLLAQSMKLRIELQGSSGPLKYVEYTTFEVSDEASEYVLTIGGFSSPHGLFDAFAIHNDWPFTTTDNDNDDFEDVNCAVNARGAWWYTACYESNLFGQYSSSGYSGIIWKYLYGGEEYTEVKAFRMMLKKIE